MRFVGFESYGFSGRHDIVIEKKYRVIFIIFIIINR
jgi:hypothetical protein